jgi:hypothetical protein
VGNAGQSGGNNSNVVQSGSNPNVPAANSNSNSNVPGSIITNSIPSTIFTHAQVNVAPAQGTGSGRNISVTHQSSVRGSRETREEDGGYATHDSTREGHHEKSREQSATKTMSSYGTSINNPTHTTALQVMTRRGGTNSNDDNSTGPRNTSYTNTVYGANLVTPPGSVDQMHLVPVQSSSANLVTPPGSVDQMHLVFVQSSSISSPNRIQEFKANGRFSGGTNLSTLKPSIVVR